MKRDSSIEIEEAALRALCDYHWPGNVRELENTLERLSAQLDKGRVITIEQVRSETQFRQSLPTIIGNEIEYRVVLRAGESLDEHLKLQQLKIYEIVRAHFGGNHTQAARWLGMDRTALYRRVDRARQRTNNWPST